MSGYFGTDAQQRLQAQAEERAEFINRSPGACQAGRTMGCDDPRRFGWEQIGKIIERDGVCGFRLISPSDVPEVKSELLARGCRFDTWDVFVADRGRAIEATREIATQPLPSGISLVQVSGDPEAAIIKSIQASMANAGLVPFSGSLLNGEIGRSVTIALATTSEVVATAHGYMPHNKFSPYHSYAWGGLISVADPYRGIGLGKLVNSLMIDRVFAELGATHIYELVSATNLPSRRMVEACGLRLDPTVVCGIATLQESSRFTK